MAIGIPISPGIARSMCWWVFPIDTTINSSSSEMPWKDGVRITRSPTRRIPVRIRPIRMIPESVELKNFLTVIRRFVRRLFLGGSSWEDITSHRVGPWYHSLSFEVCSRKGSLVMFSPIGWKGGECQILELKKEERYITEISTDRNECYSPLLVAILFAAFQYIALYFVVSR